MNHLINRFYDRSFENLRWKIAPMLTLVFQISVGLAQDWTVPGSQTYLGTTSGGSDLAIAPDGTPYVVFTNLMSSYQIKVVKFNGTDWVIVGTELSSANSTEPSIAIDATGVPYVAYIDASLKPTVKKFDGSGWISVGGAGLSDGTIGILQMELSSDGVPHVAYQDNANDGKATVMKFNGSNWVPVGVKGFSVTSIKGLSLSLSNDGVPHIAYVGQSDKATVVKYTGTEWNTIGIPDFTSTMSAISLDVDGDGNPYVAFSDIQNGGKAVVMKFAGVEWTFVGANGFSEGTARFVQIAVDNFAPYVVHAGEVGYSKITVHKFEGAEWNTVGANTITGDNYPHLDFSTIANERALYVAFGHGTLTSPMVKVFRLVSCVTPSPTNTTPVINQSICSGESTTLQVTSDAGHTVTWYNENGSVIGGDNELETAVLHSNAVFYARAISPCGPSDETPISVTVKIPPAITITGPNAICKGSPLTLTATGANSYTWEDGPATASFTTSLSDTRTFTVIGTDANNCSNSSTRTVTVNPLPVVKVSGDVELCQGENTTLVASGAHTYQWEGGPSQALYTTEPSVTTTFSVTGTNDHNCTATAIAEVVVRSLNLNVAVTNMTITAEAEPATYQWVKCESNGFVIGATSKTFTADLPGKYAVIVSQNFCEGVSNCIDLIVTGIEQSESSRISIYPNPTIGTIKTISTVKGRLTVRNNVGQFLFEVELNEWNNFTHQMELVDSGLYHFTFTDQSSKIDHTKIIVMK